MKESDGRGLKKKGLLGVHDIPNEVAGLHPPVSIGLM